MLMAHMLSRAKHMVNLTRTANKKSGIKSSYIHMHMHVHVVHVVNVFTRIAVMFSCSNISQHLTIQ